MEIWFCYELFDPASKSIQYVGATKNPLSRALDHVRKKVPTTRDWVTKQCTIAFR